MANPGPYVAAFRFVADYLARHPGMDNRRLVKTWRSWAGAGGAAPPSADKAPWVRLSLLGEHNAARRVSVRGGKSAGAGV